MTDGGRTGALLLAGVAWAGCATPATEVREPAPVRVQDESFELALWRAGRTLPPALAATRREELAAERARAQAELAEAWSRQDETRLARWLGDESTPDELWAAGATVVGELELYELADELLAALSAAAPPVRGVAARAALHRLYGRWFAHAEEAEPFLKSIRGGAGTRLLVASAAREEELARARLIAALERDPGQAAAWLADPDPRLRSDVARVLAHTTRASGEGESTLTALLAQLEREHEPEAFHELLGAALAPLERASVSDASAGRLRNLLLECTRAAADARALSVVDALARLAWRIDGPRDDVHLFAPLEGLSRWLADLAARDRARGANDPDALVGVLAGMNGLCLRARDAGLGAELRTLDTRTRVLTLLSEPAQDPAARAMAALSLGVLAQPEDAVALARTLGEEGAPMALEHAVLGALRELLAEHALGAAARTELAAAAARMTSASDPDLRTQALLLCADARLEEELAALDPTFLCQALAREEDGENARALLVLLARFARERELPALLSMESFERLASDPELLPELVRTLGALAAGSPRAVIRAATRLAGDGGSATRLARLKQALELVAALDEVAVLEFQPREHRAVAQWLWQLERAGVAAREATSRGLAFEVRVLEVHLARGEREPDPREPGLSPAERAHLAARLRADLFLGAAGRITKSQVEGSFEEALTLAPSEAQWAVLRDRARFWAAANERLRALADYRRLFEAGDAAEPWLAIPDLRSSIELLGRLDATGASGSPASAREACDLHARLVAREAWRSEPAAVRMQDLREWVLAGLEGRDPARLARIEAALSSLPLTQAAHPEALSPAPLWFGLTREAPWFQELLDLRARVRLSLRDLAAPG